MEKRIEKYTFMEFVEAVQDAVKDGWLIDFNDSDGLPSASIGYYICKVRKGDKLAALLKPKETQEDVVQQEPNFPATEESQKPQEDFVPSIMFVKEDQSPQVQQRGRPKRSTI